jgi:hypothetical protein
LAKISATDASVQRVIEAVARVEERPVSELMASLRDLQMEEAVDATASA